MNSYYRVILLYRDNLPPTFSAADNRQPGRRDAEMCGQRFDNRYVRLPVGRRGANGDDELPIPNLRHRWPFRFRFDVDGESFAHGMETCSGFIKSFLQIQNFPQESCASIKGS